MKKLLFLPLALLLFLSSCAHHSGCCSKKECSECSGKKEKCPVKNKAKNDQEGAEAAKEHSKE